LHNTVKILFFYFSQLGNGAGTLHTDVYHHKKALRMWQES